MNKNRDVKYVAYTSLGMLYMYNMSDVFSILENYYFKSLTI